MDYTLDHNSILPSVISQLLRNKYTSVSGHDIETLIKVKDKEIQYFKDCWNDLCLDNFMADGGRYRYRRYGQFLKVPTNNNLLILPHEAYVQPYSINPLNGDVKRFFEPLTPQMISSPILESILKLMAKIYDFVEGEPRKWNIRLHPYRIIANSDELGQPTPEGLHRDGVTYIASMMIHRHNITGGKTTITTEERIPLQDITLQDTFDIVMADDEKTMHTVTPITAKNRNEIGYRDVLVIAFIRVD